MAEEEQHPPPPQQDMLREEESSSETAMESEPQPLSVMMEEADNEKNSEQEESSSLLLLPLGHANREEHANKLEDDAEPPQHIEENDDGFAVGDHVYMWCSFAGIPRMFHHHGIVVGVSENQLTVADFSGLISDSTTSSGGGGALLSGDVNDAGGEDGSTAGEYAPATTATQAPPPPPQPLTKKSIFSSSSKRSTMREYTMQEPIKETKWKKVKYNAGWIRRTLQSSGTCTCVESDPPGLVLARVQFLLQHQDTVLPPYDMIKANCECVAVWCKTGKWCTLQASSFLHIMATGNVKSTTTLALIAAGQTVTVPQTGLWGMMGFTTQVSLLSTQPWLIPLIAGYGVVAVGGPVWILHRAKHAWHETTTMLNDEFWSNALERPDVFVECITHWSDL